MTSQRVARVPLRHALGLPLLAGEMRAATDSVIDDTENISNQNNGEKCHDAW